MTTLVRPDAPTDGGGGEAPPRPHEPSRYAAWRSSWAVALRMARRDVRRHKGRSALIVVMVTVPTLLLSALVTIAATSDVAGTELIGRTMGTGQAYLEGVSPTKVAQTANPAEGTSSGADPSRPVPGFDPAASPHANADAVSRVVGAPVVPISDFLARTTIGDRRISVDGVALDGRRGLGDKLRLVSGRWPEGKGQALVTAYGMSRGLPDSGRLTVTVDGAEHTLDVVGVATVHGAWGGGGLVVAEPLDDSQASGGWIVMGNDPVTWPDVLSLNEYGFLVTSAEVLRHPPSDAELSPDIRGAFSSQAQQMSLMVALGAVMLLIITALLVGPAFAVSAARQRRTLALAASNGASTAVLRRTVLASALVLGTASALLGVVLGVGVARAAVAWTARDGLGIDGPFDIRWALLAGIAVCAIASTLIAALAPARRLGRLDIVGVMRGQSVSPRPSLLLFIGGLVLAGVGSLAIFRAIAAGQVVYLGLSAEYLVTIGAVLLILGALFLVPVLLTLVGRLGSRMPTSLRMAARDLARHRSRSAPSVAAVLAAVAGLTFGLTGLSSDTAQREREYVPSTLPGEVLVSAWNAPLTTEQVRGAAPGLVVSENLIFAGDPGRYAIDPITKPYRAEFVSMVPSGCEVGQTLTSFAFSGTDGGTIDRCAVAGSESIGTGQVLLLPADELVRRLGLNAEDAAAVRNGAAVVTTGGDSVRIARGSYAVDPTATEPTDPALEVTSDETVRAVSVPRTKDSIGRLLAGNLAFATGTSTTEGWPTRGLGWTVRTTDGSPVPDATVEQLQQTLGDDVGVQLENGFQRDDGLVVGILLGVFGLLILVITLTSTALTLAEQQSDQATLAALGATRGTRRVMAAAQAFLLAAVGCVLGVAVGLVPGIAISRPLTSQGYDPITGASTTQGTILAIPWWSLLVVALAVPLVAGAIAWAGIRRAPQVTRRTT
jgi:putative ABC transport system permease protein